MTYKKRVLITGASGLIGRHCFQYLSKLPVYDVYGTDKHIANSQRYVLDQKINAALPQFPSEKFFTLDITDAGKFKYFLQEKQFDVIVHLAAALESQSPEEIIKVNQESLTHFYRACYETKVKRVVYASSMMLVAGYLEKYWQNPHYFKQITVDDELALPVDGPSAMTYAQSKYVGEQLAEKYAHQFGLSTVCARFGWINSHDRPIKVLSSIWCSINDACLFIQKSIDADVLFGKYFVCSNNQKRWVDMTNAKHDLDFEPKDSAENYLFSMWMQKLKQLILPLFAVAK